MGFIMKYKKKILLTIILLIFVVFFTFLIRIINSDGMNNSGITNIYYRTYTKEKGWSNWSKNGIKNGTLKYDILNIQVKVDKKTKGEARYRIYSTDNNWSDEYGSNAEIDNQNIIGIKFGLSGTLHKTSDICYRTYNNEDKWLGWSCSDMINGNIGQNITGIQIKIIPKNVIYREYLKDYNTLNKNSIGF